MAGGSLKQTVGNILRRNNVTHPDQVRALSDAEFLGFWGAGVAGLVIFHDMRGADDQAIREWLGVSSPPLPPLPSLAGGSGPITLDELSAALSDRHGKAVWRRYVLGETLRVIGDSFGVSRERVRQITDAGISKIRRIVWRDSANRQRIAMTSRNLYVGVFGEDPTERGV